MTTELTNVSPVNTITILDKLIRAGWKVTIRNYGNITSITAIQWDEIYGADTENGLLYATFQLYREMQAVGAIS